MRVVNDINVEDLFLALATQVSTDYDSGNSDYTATSLVNPPLENKQVKEGAEVVDVISEMGPSVLGTVAHTGFQKAAEQLWPNAITEKRLFLTVKVDGIETKISVQIDLYLPDNRLLVDYKVLGVFSMKMMPNPGYQFQLNLGAFCLRQRGHKVEGLQNWIVVKDRSAHDGFEAFETIDTDVWSDERVLNELTLRIRDQRSGRRCTQEEMWAKPVVWKCMKPDGKRSLKNCETEAEASTFCRSYKGKGEKPVPEKHESERTYCKRFCSVRYSCEHNIHKDEMVKI